MNEETELKHLLGEAILNPNDFNSLAKGVEQETKEEVDRLLVSKVCSRFEHAHLVPNKAPKGFIEVTANVDKTIAVRDNLKIMEEVFDSLNVIDRAFLNSLNDRALLTVTAPEFMPRTFTGMRSTLKENRHSGSRMLVSKSVWADIMADTEFADWFDPSKKEDLHSGALGEIFGVVLFEGDRWEQSDGAFMFGKHAASLWTNTHVGYNLTSGQLHLTVEARIFWNPKAVVKMVRGGSDYLRVLKPGHPVKEGKQFANCKSCLCSFQYGAANVVNKTVLCPYCGNYHSPYTEPLEAYTPHQVAKMLKCHPETVRRNIRSGDLRAAKLGSSYRLLLDDVKKWWVESGGIWED